MKTLLTHEALDWSLRHHLRYGDTDLFPRAFEFQIAEAQWPELREQLATRNLESYEWRPGRTMLVMKDGVSFRRAAQFDPLDSLLFAALMWTIGPALEAHRPSRDRHVVFSYRYKPSSSGQLFAPGKPKQAFWTHTMVACGKYENPWLVITDIADFYNQIRHSYLEEQLKHLIPTTGFVAPIMKALRAVQGESDIGVPVGPHAAHLLAELALIPFDDFMSDLGHGHLRFVDDVHVACESESKAREALFDIADYMHSHLKLSLSRHKTRVLGDGELKAYARTALGTPERDEDEVRLQIRKVIRDHTSGDDEDETDLSDLTSEEQSALTQENLERVLEELLDEDAQIVLRQYLRSLSHLQAPGAVEFVSARLGEMLPALPEALNYLANTLPHFNGDRANVTKRLIDALDLPVVKKSEHMQSLVLATFVQFPHLDDFKRVAPRFDVAPPAAQREILLLAGKLKRAGWLKPRINANVGGDPWRLRALVEASRCLSAGARRDIQAHVRRLLGSRASLIEDPQRHDRDPSVTVHLAAAVYKAARTQEVTLTFTTAPEEQACQEFAERYAGTVLRVDGGMAVLRGVDVKRLLADAEADRLEGPAGMPALTELVLGDGQCLYERLPDVVFGTPAEEDVETNAIKAALKKTDVLLVTTAEIEKRAVLSRLGALPGQKKVLVGSLGNLTYRIGQFGRYATGHVHTTQGADGRQGATLTVREALAGGNFKACLVIGIAFGFDRRAQRLGDILVADQVQPYEHAKVQGKGEQITPRGTPMSCGNVLSERFRNRMSDWDRQRTVTRVAIHQGTVLSGAKLINSAPFRDRLYETFKALKPVGGEMEGHGAYASAEAGKLREIVLVKAICDWADGDKNDRAQPFAADAAVDACHHLLSKPDVLHDLKAKDLPLPVSGPTELPDISELLREEPGASPLTFEDDIPL
jgi:nucleoside phosphorylase